MDLIIQSNQNDQFPLHKLEELLDSLFSTIYSIDIAIKKLTSGEDVDIDNMQRTVDESFNELTEVIAECNTYL